MNDENLFTFNEFYIKTLMLNMSDHANIKAILQEVATFKVLAEKATELNKIVQQFDGYEDENIKIHLGTEGTIQWPAAELMSRVNALMSVAIVELKRQEMVIDRMAQAIGREVSAEENSDADMWLAEWRRDVNEFLDRHHWLPTQLTRSLLLHGNRYHRAMLKGSTDGVAPPKFREVLPTIVSGEIYARNIGSVWRKELQRALDEEKSLGETDEDSI